MDPGALALPLLDGGDGLAGVGSQRAQFVQLSIDAGRDGAPVGQVHRGIGQERPLQLFPQVLEQIEPRRAGQPARGREALQARMEVGEPGERRAEGGRIPGPCAVERNAGEHALHVLDRAQGFAQVLAVDQAVGRDADRLQPRFDLRPVDQRPHQRRPQQPFAHRGHAAVEIGEERRLAGAAGEERFNQLQVAHRHCIQLQVFCALVVPDVLMCCSSICWVLRA